MINNFIKKYGQLSDSSIYKILFYSSIEKDIEKKGVKLYINCYDIEDCKYDFIRLDFSDIINLTFVENEYFKNFAPKDVFIEMKNDIISFDFDPIDFIDHLQENSNSLFKIKARLFRFSKVSD